MRVEQNPLGEALGVFLFLYSYLEFREITNNGDPSKYVTNIGSDLFVVTSYMYNFGDSGTGDSD